MKRGLLLLPAFAAFGAALALGTPVARADWPAWAIEDALSAHKNEAGFQDGFAYTIWGATRFSFSGWMLFPKWADRTLETAPDPEFESPGVKVAVHLSRKNGKIRKAPLLILLPGMFGNVDDAVCASQMEFYSSLGYHVVAFPNPWSTSYRAAKPRSMAGAIHAEAAAMTRLIAWARERVGPESISRVDLVGISYGAFLAPFVFGNDCAAPEPSIDGFAMSFSPPADIAQSMARLDSELGDLSNGSENACLKTASSPLFLLEFALAPSERHVAERYLSCARAPVVGGFLEWITEMIKTFGEPELARQWGLNPGFHRYLDLFAPEVENELETGGEASLIHRIQSLPSSCRARFGVLSASDDFLNGPESWSTATGPVYILIPRGGHTGFLPDGWFKQFRQKLYEKLYLNEEKSGTPTN